MAIRTVINNKGVVSTKGASGLQISDNVANTGFSPYRVDGGTDSANPSGLAFTIDKPGFYWVSGSGLCTGSVSAKPSAHPGAFLSFGTTNVGLGFMLTGSRSTNAVGAFVANGVGALSASAGFVGASNLTVGDKLTVKPGGSVCLWSDGFYWIPMASSGTLLIQT